MVVSLKAGLATFTRRDIVALSRRGHAITLLPTKVGRGPAVPPDVACMDLSALDTTKSLLSALGRLRSVPGASAAFDAAIACGEFRSLLLALGYFGALPRPDLVYAVFGDRKFFTGVFLSMLWDCPIAVTTHAYELYNNPNPDMFRFALSHVPTIMTVTEYNRVVLNEQWGVPLERIQVVRISVDETIFCPAERFVVLTVGMTSYKKGHDVLFSAVSAIADSRIELWVVGSPGGAYPIDAPLLAESKGIADQCVFFGQLPEAAVAALMRKADLFCLPSRTDPDGNREGFPTVIAEAMYMGLPVVSTDHVEIPSILPSIIVREDSDTELAEGLRRYMESPALRIADGQRNRQIASRLFVGAPHAQLERTLLTIADNQKGSRQ